MTSDDVAAALWPTVGTGRDLAGMWPLAVLSHLLLQWPIWGRASC